MNEKHINIVALNIPYPPDYGGMIDIYYKLLALFHEGIKLHLHCFEYNRSRAPQLEKFCEEIHYYKRTKGIKYLLSRTPYIVKTRADLSLLKNLNQNNYPILLEGIHCSYLVNNKLLQTRKIVLRSHNIEHEYYYQLARSERKISDKIYLLSEAIKLKYYFKSLKNIHQFLAISENDRTSHLKYFEKVSYLPAFHSNNEITASQGKSDYILYHGNLSVAENIHAAIYLIENVFSKIDYRVIIAGKNPDKKLLDATKNFNNINVEANPDDSKMKNLLKNAHINVLITFQNTGIKLKLLNALYKGRFVIVNSEMVNNTGLEELCYIEDTPAGIKKKILEVMHNAFTYELIDRRKQVLGQKFSNSENAKKIIDIIFT